MRKFRVVIGLGCALSTAAADAAVQCDQVVEATMAELRLGTETWSEQHEAWARTAAASSCIKASSGLYGAADTKSEQLTDKAVDSNAEGDDGIFSIFSDTGITVEPMSGAPSKKPYERTR